MKSSFVLDNLVRLRFGSTSNCVLLMKASDITAASESIGFCKRGSALDDKKQNLGYLSVNYSQLL